MTAFREDADGWPVFDEEHEPEPDNVVHLRERGPSTEQATQEGATAASSTDTSTWTPVDLTAALEGRSIDPAPTVLRRDDGPALLYAGKVHTVSGESESLKSWLLLVAVAEQLARGQHAAWIDFEDSPEAVVGRLLALGSPPSSIADLFHYVRPEVPLDEAGSAAFAPVMLAAPSLVVLDGVTEAMSVYGLEPLANSDVAIFYAKLPRRIARHGPAVALIDHVVKNREGRGRYAIGAQHKLAGIDGAAYVVELVTPFGHGQHGITRIEVAKDRPGRVREHSVGKRIAELHLRSEPDGSVFAELRAPAVATGPDGAFRPTVLMERVSRALESAGAEGLSGNQVEHEVTGRASNVRAARTCLLEEGFIEADKQPTGTVYRSRSPFRHEEPEAE